MSTYRLHPERALPFLPHREPTPARRSADAFLTGVVERARGALRRMVRAARPSGASAPVEREVMVPRAYGDLDAALARARVVAERRAAIVADAAPAAGRCPDCQAELGPGKYCPECGRSLVPARSCRMCEAELPGGSRFCLECGAQA